MNSPSPLSGPRRPEPTGRAGIVRNVGFFLIGSILAKAIGAVQTFWLARELGPAEYGLWFTLLLIISYGPIACLGVVEVLQKQLPQYRTTGDQNAIKRIEGAVMGTVILACILVILLASGILVWLFAKDQSKNAASIATMSVALCASYFSNFYLDRHAAYEDFKGTAAIASFRALCSILLICGFTVLWGLNGAVLGYLLHELLTLLFSAWRSTKQHGLVGIVFDLKLTVQAISIGFPISVTWYLFILLNSADRAILGFYVSNALIGYYGLAVGFASIFALVPTAVGRVLYPRVNYEVVRLDRSNDVSNLVIGAGFSLSLAMSFLQAVVLVAMPLVYQAILPSYRPGLLAGELLILGIFSTGLVRTAVNYLIALNKQRLILSYAAIAIIVNVFLNILMLKMGFGLAGVAVGTSLASLIVNLQVWYSAMRFMGLARGKTWFNLTMLYVPLGTLICGIVSIRMLIPGFMTDSSLLLALVSPILLLLQLTMMWFTPLYRAELLKWIKYIVRMCSTSRLSLKKVPPIAEQHAVSPSSR
jgi:O-antigen/teichoic acid export membrane protein